MRHMKRFVSLLLVMCMLASCALAENAGGDITPPMTEAPADVPTEAPTEKPAEDPTEIPTENPTETPVADPTEEPTAEPVEEPTAEPTEEPGPIPTEEPTEEPTGEPTEEPSEEPTEEPTEEPSEMPTEEPTHQPPAEATAPVWDESSCQHNTAECERAPSCDIPGCTHIEKDVHELDVPACALGEWLLDAQEAHPIATLSVRSIVIDLNKGDAVLYRSGSYKVVGGNLRPGASLTIKKDRVVALEIDSAAIGTLTLEPKSQLSINLEKESAMGALDAQGYNAITFRKGGALTISSVSVKTEINKDNEEIDTVFFEVLGGSLIADIKEKSGLRPFVFDGTGAFSVTVAGIPYQATAHADGKVCLWLPAPEAGMKWDAALMDGVLAVEQTADLPQDNMGDIAVGTDNVLQAGTYELTGNVVEGTHLTIATDGVTVVLKNATASGTLIDASSAYTLQVMGENTIDTIAGSGAVTLQGDGRLTVTGKLPAQVKFLAGTYVLSEIPAGYEACKVGYLLSNQAVTLDNAPYPLIMSAGGDLLLPTPAQDRSYVIVADDQTITVRTANAGEKAFSLSADNPTADAGDAAVFTVTGDGSFVTGSITASGATAHANFQNVRLQGDELLQLRGEHLTVTLTGDNTLQSASGRALALDAGSTLALNVASGRLALRGQNDLSGVTLQGNILVEPATSLPHAALLIRDKSGNPVPNKELTVSVGGQTWQYMTHYDGSLHLWGLGDLSGQDIAATDGENVYTAVIVDNQAQLTTGLTEFSDVTFQSQADGSLLMSWAVPGAAVTGIQLLYGKTAVAMPDTYVAGAMHVAGKDFSARVTGIPAGSVVTVRVYASAQAGAVFNEETADGFQFGKVFTYVHKATWTYDGKKGSADADYSGKVYEPKIDVPEGASISYAGDRLVNGKPFYPGNYVMKVTIPEGDARYLPGTTEIPFTINKRMITIVPGYNLQKYRGSSDPEFTFTVEGLLEGDKITGVLTREAGEEVGEYKWLTTGFGFTRDLYDIRIDPDALPFLIMPYAGMLTIQVNEVMHPVEQTIVLKDGRRLTVLLDAQESLTVTHSVLGSLVRGEKDEAKVFTPQLSWNPDTDEVLLMMRAEPEMNEDHGYVTDSMGNPVWALRRIRVIRSGLEHMDRMGFTALELINKDAAISCRIEDFLSDEMTAFIEEAGLNMNSAEFWLTVEPVADIPDGLRPVTDGWRVRASLIVNKQEVDVTGMLPSLTVMMNMEPVAELLNSMDRYDEELFPEQYTLCYEDGAILEEASFMEPFAEDELEKAQFPTMMYVSRYLAAPLTAPGTVYAVSAPAEAAAE